MPRDVFGIEFKDVDNTTPYVDAILYLARKNIVNGYPDGRFLGRHELNRAELVTLMSRYILKGRVLEIPQTSCFEDVHQEWFAPSICHAKKQGWIQGYADKRFHPEQVVNKAEALKILFRALHLPSDLEQPEFLFNDVLLTSWFADEVGYAYRYHFVDEKGDRFYPEAPMTRGYFSEILYRVITHEFARLQKRTGIASFFAVFVDESTHPSLQQEIDGFVQDLKSDGSSVTLFHDDWDNPEHVRLLLQNLYRAKALSGAFLIGSIPVPVFEESDGKRLVSDWYYQDLDNTLFQDEDSDGAIDKEFYASLNPISDREIWTARILPPVADDEYVILLKRFFEKYHRFVLGSLSYSRKLLLFDSIGMNQQGKTNIISETLNVFIGEDRLYQKRSEIEVVYNDSLSKQKTIFLNRLSAPYEINWITINGGLLNEWIGEDVTVSLSDIQRVSPQGLYYHIVGTSHGDFSQNNYLAGWYLFSGNALAVNAQSSQEESSDDEMDQLVSLQYGASIGDVFRNDTRFLSPQLFGMANIQIRKPLAEKADTPLLMVKKLSIDFGEILEEEDSILPLFFKNGGNKDLLLKIKSLGYVINSQSSENDRFPFYVYDDADSSNSSFKNDWISIKAGQIFQLPIVFDPSTVGLPGIYEGRMLMYTNDPEHPFVRLYLRGKAL